MATTKQLEMTMTKLPVTKTKITKRSDAVIAAMLGAAMRDAAEHLARVRGLADAMLAAADIAHRERAYLDLLAELREAHDACLFFAGPVTS